MAARVAPDEGVDAAADGAATAATLRLAPPSERLFDPKRVCLGAITPPQEPPEAAPVAPAPQVVGDCLVEQETGYEICACRVGAEM